MSILYILSLLSISMGKEKFLRRKLQGLDLSRSECLKRGPSMHCYPSNDCDQGWQCVPGKDVDASEWVGTYCYDPACKSDGTNRVDGNEGESLSVVLPGGFLPEDECWKDRCGTNTKCPDGLSCLEKGQAACFCRNSTKYRKNCSPVVNNVLDSEDSSCKLEFTDDVWAMSPTTPAPTPTTSHGPTPPPTKTPSPSHSKSNKSTRRKLSIRRSPQISH